MQAGLYVSLSGQVALERRLATIANNIANVGTAGYRAEEIKFDTLYSKIASESTAYSSTGKSYVSDRAGGIEKTGNPLDVAIQGAGWLAIQTPSGTTYTKDGRMKILDTGELQTLNGNPILDSSNAPILIDPQGAAPQISHDGKITQNGRQIGTLGLFTIDVSKGYLRSENSSIIPATAAQPIEDFASIGIVQGFVEQSNVNAVAEMTNLINVTRAFDGLQNSIDESESSLKKAIQILGGG